MVDKKQDTKTSAPEEWSRPTTIKKPLKLVLEIICLVLLSLPYILWAGVMNVLAKPKSLKDKVVLVTGAAGGLGRELCLKFAELGCRIACVDVVDHGTEETGRLIKQKYPGIAVFTYHCDVASVEEIKQLHRNVFQDLGPVDLLINNAGIIREAKFLDITDDKLDRIINVNLKSHFLTIRQFLPDMLNRNSGHIVAISSMAAMGGMPKGAEYSATKHGVLGMMESLYEDLRETPGNNVKTTTICPYFFRSLGQNKKRLDLRLPEISLEETATMTINAIRKNKTVASIPSSLYWLAIFMKLLPQNMVNMIKDIFHTKIHT